MEKREVKRASEKRFLILDSGSRIEDKKRELCENFKERRAWIVVKRRNSSEKLLNLREA